MSPKITPEMQRCIDNCLECYSSCTETAVHCLELGGAHAKAPHLRLLKDCSLICMTSADFMLGGSKYQPQVSEICAEICERCAEDCERIGGGDHLMKQCAEACRRCADSCRQMSRSVARV
jgi:hypothetical protein